MNIGNFGSYFEILAGLNLAYISVEAIFDYAINKKILTTRNENLFRKQFVDIANTEMQMAPHRARPDREKVQEDIENILKYVRSFGIFPESFQPAFLMSFLFCIYVLLNYGFEYTFLDLNLSAEFVIVINLLFLIKSFSKDFCDRFKNKLIWIPLILIGFLVNIIISYFKFSICSYYPEICFLNDSQQAFIACIAAASSFIFYFIRVMFYNFSLIRLTRLFLERFIEDDVFVLLGLNSQAYAESGNKGRIHKMKRYIRSTKNAYERLDQIKVKEEEVNEKTKT